MYAMGVVLPPGLLAIVLSAIARARLAPSASTAWTWSGCGSNFEAFSPEGFQGFVQILGEDLLAIHAANACPAAFNVDHLDICLGCENLVHGENIANIRVAGIGTLDAMLGR